MDDNRGFEQQNTEPHSAGNKLMPVILGTAGSVLYDESRKKREKRRARRWIILFVICALLAVFVLLYKAAPFRLAMDIYENGFALYLRNKEETPAEAPVTEVTPEVRPEVSPILPQLTPEENVDAGKSLSEIYDANIDSVVCIISSDSEGFGVASGIIVRGDGYIATNEHVVAEAEEIFVLLSDETRYPAVLVGSDRATDLAVLKIEAVGLSAATPGDSEKVRVGDSVVAIGNPLGTELRGTLTDGVISAINRNVEINGNTMTLLQTNAALNSGNSGGPLINMDGEVIGINTYKSSSYFETVEGLGFAIPISIALPIIDELIEAGFVSGRPSIGIQTPAYDYPPSVAQYYDIPQGVMVEAVHTGSDAYLKGLQRGDIITAVNGTEITTNSGLSEQKNLFSVGDEVTLTVYRKGEYLEITVILMDEALMTW